MRRVSAIDSHTGGEPTRVVIAGGPDLGRGPLAGRLDRFRNWFDQFRSAVVNEPRGNNAMVGALLCEPCDAACDAAVIYFNNVGYLGMCGHGTIGVVVTLQYLGRLRHDACRLETVCGVVDARLNPGGGVSIRNVPSYRSRARVPVSVPGIGEMVGDVAWGGNWFFLVSEHGQELSLGRVDELTDFTWRIRRALEDNGITGADGGEIDHIELFAPPTVSGANSRNFVLCPGKAYDRSPCGTGTSAKLACLYADGKLAPGEVWRQESIVGTVFEGRIEAIHAATDAAIDAVVLPEITGFAYVNAELDLILDDRDPFCSGIRRAGTPPA
ncbi:MAG: proline racemase family protein [Bryobacteraceae bacterium]